jgi:hypothetical protein
MPGVPRQNSFQPNKKAQTSGAFFYLVLRDIFFSVSLFLVCPQPYSQKAGLAN